MFKRGNRVKIDDDLGPHMSHFRKGCEAVIEHSYYEKYGGELRQMTEFALMFDDGSTSAWYPGCCLTLIDEGGEHLLTEITNRRKVRELHETDLQWIVENWKQIRDKVPGATIGKLMSLIGITEPWGSHGEGYVYYSNARYAWQLFDPILSSGDRDKLDEFLRKLKEVSNA